MDNIMLKIENVSKMYKLGQIGGTTLRDELQRKHAKFRGKEDPTKKIGAKDYNVGETFMALDEISFEVNKGERVGIIGHNGAGKSTLLKLISRVTAPSAGIIRLNGRVASMLEVGTGFHAELTGRENIYMNGAILGMTKKEIDAKMDDIIEFSECRQFIDTPVKRYSSGMYVKLAFSVAAHLDSEIMIMDEVLAVGDMAFQKKCLDKMNDVSKTQGRTILYVSHNMNTIRELCDRCIVLNHGRIIFDGDVEKAIDKYIGASDISPRKVCFTDKSTVISTKDVIIESAESCNSDPWRINVGEKLCYSIKVKAKKDIVDIGYRSRLQYVDGSSVSVLMAPKLFSCNCDECKIITLEADTTQLVPGIYSLTPALYGVNKYGGQQFYDHHDRAITFVVETIPGFNEDMTWDRRYWGDIRLPQYRKIDEITIG